MTTPQISLLVGSDTLGWEELGGKAVLGEMAKCMPGGDGSLDFTLYGDDARAARNVLIPGDARVILRANGQPVWGGRVCSDPVRHRLDCQSTVEVSCSGLYGLAARDGRYGYIGADTDLSQWESGWYFSEHPGRFSVSTDGVLELRAESDRTYATSDIVSLIYRIQGEMLSGIYISGMEFEFQCNLLTGWDATVVGMEDPGSAMGFAYWTRSGGGAVGSWTAASFNAPASHATQVLELSLYNGTAGGAPASDVWIKLRKVRVFGRWSDAGKTTADSTLTIGDIFTDLAGEVGVTDVNVDTALSTYPVEQFVSRFPTDVAETMRQVCALYTSPVEAFFDLDPVTAAERFTARVRPAETALAAGNRRWIVGGRGGESTDDLMRDWEATPEQIQVLYPVKDHASLPDGTLCSVTYPGGTESSLPCAEVVDLSGDGAPMTASVAGNYAQAIWNYRQSNRYTGTVAVGEAAHDSDGVDTPTYLLRPGDRITALDRDDTDLFGETLYVSETSYDWQTHTGSATIADPFDPLERVYGGRSSGVGVWFRDRHHRDAGGTRHGR